MSSCRPSLTSLRRSENFVKLRVSTAFFYVTHLEAAIAFYTQTLGLSLRARQGDRWAEVDAGSISIGLHPVEPGDEVDSDGGATLSFAVEDLEATLNQLKARGASVGQIRVAPRGKFAMLRDPDGNWLHFIELDPKWMAATGYSLPGRPSE